MQRSLTQAAAGPEMGGHDGLSAVIPAAVTLHTHIIPDDISVMNYVRLPCPCLPLDVAVSISCKCHTKVKRLSMVIIMDLSAHTLQVLNLVRKF